VFEEGSSISNILIVRPLFCRPDAKFYAPLNQKAQSSSLHELDCALLLARPFRELAASLKYVTKIDDNNQANNTKGIFNRAGDSGAVVLSWLTILIALQQLPPI